MLIDTCRFRKVQVPVASIYGRKVLLVLAGVDIPANGKFEAGVIKAGWLLERRNGKYAIYESIGSLIRSGHQRIMFYGNRKRGELHLLIRLRKDTDGFTSAVMARRNIVEEARLSTESLIAGVGSELSGSSNGHKQAARQELMDAASSIDRQGRRNPGRQRMLLAHARNHLDDRTKEIGPIRDSIMPWLTVLAEYNHERILVARGIASTLNRLLFRSGQVWTDASDRSCRVLVARAKTLNVQPFLSYRDQLIRDLRQARGDLSQGDFQGLRLLCTVVNRARCCLAHVRLEDIRGHLEMLGHEDHKRIFEPETLERLIEVQRERLMHFIDNLGDVDDPDGATKLERAKASLERAYQSLIHHCTIGEVVPLLNEALALF